MRYAPRLSSHAWRRLFISPLCLADVCFSFWPALLFVLQNCEYELCPDGIEYRVASKNLVRLIWAERPRTVLMIKKPGDKEISRVSVAASEGLTRTRDGLRSRVVFVLELRCLPLLTLAIDGAVLWCTGL